MKTAVPYYGVGVVHFRHGVDPTEQAGPVDGIADIDALESDTAGITLSDDDHDNLLTLGLSIGYDTRDNYVAPRRGWWAELEAAKTGLLAGNGDFWSVLFDVRKYVPLGARYSLSRLPCLAIWASPGTIWTNSTETSSSAGAVWVCV